MYQAILRFHGRLNDLISPRKRKREHSLRFITGPAVKDAIECLGPPHPEVGLVVVDARPVSFRYQLAHGIEIDVYPYGEHPAYAHNPLPMLKPPGPPRFLADVHLGTLARYLRALGLDTTYEPMDRGDAFLSRIASQENKILITRDIGLLKRSRVVYGYWPRNTDPKIQFHELVERYDLRGRSVPFSRCIACNFEIESVAKEQIADRLPERVRQNFESFALCRGCQKVYWEGSHYHQLKTFLSRV